MSRKKTMLYIMLAFIAGCFVMSAVLVIYFKRTVSQTGSEIVLEYGDTFLNVPLVDSSGNIVNIESYKEDYTFVYYLDKNCGTCVEDLSIVKRIIDVYEDMSVANMIIWDGEIGNKQTQKRAISQEYNFTLDNAYISTSTPTFFILDEDKEVIFVCNSMDDMIRKISGLDISSMDVINEKYIRTLADKQSVGEKPIMVYFSMVGCPDCEFATHVMEEANLQDEFEVITFYRDRENVPKESQAWIDNGGLLAEIYDIEWYPSFLILYNSGDYRIVGETDSQQLKEVLLDCIKLF